MGKLTGNTLVARALLAEGSEAIFYLADGPMFDVMWESMRLGIRGIHTRHEQGGSRSRPTCPATASTPGPTGAWGWPSPTPSGPSWPSRTSRSSPSPATAPSG